MADIATASASKNKLSGKKKAAAFMVAIGVEHAAKIYKNLKMEEVEALTLEVATINKLTPEMIDEVLGDFYEMCLAQKFISEGGVDFAKDILEKTYGIQNARSIIEKVIISIGTKDFDFMKKADAKQLFNFIQNEHPQTIALVVSYATKGQASVILTSLPRQKQLEVVERIAMMDRIAPDVLHEVEAALQKKLSTIGTTEIPNIGGVKYAAELLNMVDRGTEKFITDEMSKKDPDLVNDIRKLMFVFEDIVMLDDTAIQTVVRSVDPKDLVAALKNANDDVKEVVFSNMTKRNAEIVREDIQYAKNIRARDVESAQQRIVAKIRELEESGQIFVAHGKDDEIV